MNARVFSGTVRVTAIPPSDRGFAYGDGLFETMRAHGGEVPWWERHWARLERGATRLRLGLPEQSHVRAEAGRLLDGGGGVLKLVVSRGDGGRGYAPDGALSPTWVLSEHPSPAHTPRGLKLRWCDTRLALQPLLAGLKHCNRLEQVLARGEWGDLPTSEVDADDGLMRSTEGDVVCATAANLFVLTRGRSLTPRLERCGIEGVCRDWVMAAQATEEVRLTATDVETADAVFLCNAVRGILPVARLGTRVWSPHPQVSALQQRLAAAHPAFAVTPSELS